MAMTPEQWLDAYRKAWVDLDSDAAAALAGTGLTAADLDGAGEALPGDALGVAVRYLAAHANARRLTRDLVNAATRVHTLVTAVKSHTQMDRAAVPEPVALGRHLADAITLLGSKAAAREITVELRVESGLPPVHGVVGELNHVWLNLIDNAVQAMAREGTLTIRTYREDDCAVIGIGDTGSGVPDEIVGRIFEPFFTTKPVGEGTGLGLDISWRIVVKKHHGDIRVESRPGDTWFLVRLPLTPPDDAPALGRSEGIDD